MIYINERELSADEDGFEERLIDTLHGTLWPLRALCRSLHEAEKESGQHDLALVIETLLHQAAVAQQELCSYLERKVGGISFNMDTSGENRHRGHRYITGLFVDEKP
jgi:hypothetical protein